MVLFGVGWNFELPSPRTSMIGVFWYFFGFDTRDSPSEHKLESVKSLSKTTFPFWFVDLTPIVGLFTIPK